MTTTTPTPEGLSVQVEGLREGQTRLEAAGVGTNRLIVETNRETNKRIDQLILAVVVIGGGRWRDYHTGVETPWGFVRTPLVRPTILMSISRIRQPGCRIPAVSRPCI